jgi:hypothetical protein
MGRLRATGPASSSAAEPAQGAGRAGAAHPGRPKAVSAGDPGPCWRRSRACHCRRRSRCAGSGRRPRCAAIQLVTGHQMTAAAVVLTTGTFLNGSCMSATSAAKGGRVGDPASVRLAQQIRALGSADGSPEDRHAAAAGRAHDRLGAAGDATGRRRARDAVVPEQGADRAPDRLRHHAHVRSQRIRSFATTCRFRRCMAAISKASGRAIARRSRTRSCALPTRPATRFSWNRKGLMTIHVYPNGISTSLPVEVQEAYVQTIAGWSARSSRSPAMPSNMTISIRATCGHTGKQGRAGAVPGGPDQRHDRI